MKKQKRTWAEWVEERINHVHFTSRAQETLDGVLLSDGSLHRIGERCTASLRIAQTPRRRGWLLQVKDSLEASGMTIKIGSSVVKPTLLEGRMLPGGKYDLLRSLNYEELVAEQKRWYVNGKKIVPGDLELTPTVLLHWFCGDGRGGDKKGTLGFCTDGFHEVDVDFLVERLRLDLDILSTRSKSHRGHPQILISRRDEAEKVRVILEPLIHDCCRYKLRFVRPLQTKGRGRRLSNDLKEAIRKDRGTSTMQIAANKHGVAASAVWKLWNE